MGNFNVLKTSPQGDRSMAYPEGVDLDSCKKWLEEYGPAPIGWLYQITNLNRAKKKNKKPEYVKLSGFTAEGDLLETVKCGHKTNLGWYTIKMAKRDLRKQGCSFFSQEKVWVSETPSS